MAPNETSVYVFYVGLQGENSIYAMITGAYVRPAGCCSDIGVGFLPGSMVSELPWVALKLVMERRRDGLQFVDNKKAPLLFEQGFSF